MILARTLAFIFATAGSLSLAEEAQKSPPFELKNRSSFGLKPGTRVPFWPIGWSKEKAVAVTLTPVAAKAFLIQPNHFTVSSILLSHPPLATVNGRAFGEGEFLPVQVGGQPIKVLVKAIRDGGVWLDQSGHQIFVPLRRDKIIPRSAPDAPEAAPEFSIKIDAKP